MPQIEHALPADVTPLEGAKQGVYRPGLVTTRTDYGVGLSRVWSEYNLRSYEWTPSLFTSTSDDLEELEWFLHHVGVGSPFWVVEKLTGKHPRLVLSPLGDGSADTIALPISGATTGLAVFAGGVPTGAYTQHTTANLLTNSEAECSDQSEWSDPNSTLANRTGVCCDGNEAVKVTPDGANNPVVTAVTSTAGLTAANTFTGMAAILNTSATTRQWRVSINWRTTADADISTTDGTLTNCPQGDWTIITVSGTSPALTAKARLKITRNENTDVGVFYFDCTAINPGEYDRWHLPSRAPNLIEFTTAPTANQRVTAYAEGIRMARCRLDQTQVGWTLLSPGHTRPGRLVMHEQVEI